jgi:hypothetical protein
VRAVFSTPESGGLWDAEVDKAFEAAKPHIVRWCLHLESHKPNSHNTGKLTAHATILVIVLLLLLASAVATATATADITSYYSVDDLPPPIIFNK